VNILIVNWTWYPIGGDWTYIDSICKLYESKGHQIIPFSVHNEKNVQTPYNKYSLAGIDYKVFYKNLTFKSGIDLLTKSIYSTEAKQKLNLLLYENHIDIAQLNNINNYHTPSIISVLKKAKIPIVWRILDYKLICPNNTFLSNGKICEACYKHKYYNCILNKCKNNSRMASTLMTLESYFYYIMPFYKHITGELTLKRKLINLFVKRHNVIKITFQCHQSEFTRDMFVKYGYDIKRTNIIENPYDCSEIKPKYTGDDYILYFGRISKEKGIFTLLNAMKSLNDIKLKIVGDGPEYDEYLNYTIQNSISNVSFIGAKWDKELEPIIENCKFVIVPSEWYEPSPYAVLQSFSYGKPVIAANIGGLKDLIISNETGLLFKVGDKDDLSNSIRYLYQSQSLIRTMGANARGQVERKNNPERYYNDTMTIFNNLINF